MPPSFKELEISYSPWHPYTWLLLFSCSVRFDSLATPWTVARQDPLSMRFPRQEHWSGLPLSSPGDLPNSGVKWNSSFYIRLARNVNKGSKKGIWFLQSSRCCHTPQWLPRSWRDGKSSHPPHLNKELGYKQSGNRIWPQVAEVLMKGKNSVSPEACIFPYIEEHWIP